MGDTRTTTGAGDPLLRSIASAPPMSPPVPGMPVFEVAADEPVHREVDDPALALGRWGLRFSDADTQSRYRAWHIEQLVPFFRQGAIGGVVGSAAGLIGFGLAQPGKFWIAAAVIVGILWPMDALVYWLCARPSRYRFILPISAPGIAIQGILVVGLFYWGIQAPDVAYGWAILIALFAYLINRLPEVHAAAGTLPFLGFHQWLLLTAVEQGTVTRASAVWYTIEVWTIFAVGMVCSVLLNRGLRNAYRQQRIIETQRAELAHLQDEVRAREVKVLNEEVRRQVAERSRDLAEALLRLGDAPPVPARLVPGAVIEDRYRIVRPLGEGGMGQVHEVERLTDGRRLALKVMTRAARRDALVRFAREAQIAAQLDHPNVVAALDVGVTRAGTLFVVMQLVTGTTLAEQQAHFGDAGWALPVLLQVAKALAAMHAHRIVHRDLKPSNILLERTAVKVADFGIASLADDDADGGARGDLTRTGSIMGTPLYMAPELARGAREATPAADLFSFGVVAYQVLANRMPFSSPPVLEVLAGRPLPVPQPLSGALSPLVERCLAHVPDGRPTADEVVRAITGL